MSRDKQTALCKPVDDSWHKLLYDCSDWLFCTSAASVKAVPWHSNAGNGLAPAQSTAACIARIGTFESPRPSAPTRPLQTHTRRASHKMCSFIQFL